MSYGIVSEVSREHPELLTANLGRTCFQHTQLVVAKLRGRGFEAYLMCKSPGEGQYTPPGFTPRDVIGLDGKTYRCSGFSHDAIWCDQAQYDTLGSANEHDRPIYRRQGDPNWSFDPADGPQIVATPAWNPVKPSDWRHNNPPFMESVPTPDPSPGSSLPPGREEALIELNWLDAYYMAPEGLQRPEGLSLNGAPDFEGVAAWYLDVYQRERMKGKSKEEARAAYVKEIRESKEWRAKHPGETP